MPDEVELVEDPELTARRARLRRVFYAIVGPAAVGTVALAVVHVVRPRHAAQLAVTQHAFVAPAASTVAWPEPDPGPSVAVPEGAVPPPASRVKQKRAWAWKTSQR
jgi:hypothetical protein